MREQRDSGDDEDMDKNSEDEEGQLEEQIERLQEKVESAQSEQKNLFLVIFQVPKPQARCLPSSDHTHFLHTLNVFYFVLVFSSVSSCC